MLRLEVHKNIEQWQTIISYLLSVLIYTLFALAGKGSLMNHVIDENFMLELLFLSHVIPSVTEILL